MLERLVICNLFTIGPVLLLVPVLVLGGTATLALIGVISVLL